MMKRPYRLVEIWVNSAGKEFRRVPGTYSTESVGRREIERLRFNRPDRLFLLQMHGSTAYDLSRGNRGGAAPTRKGIL